VDADPSRLELCSKRFSEHVQAALRCGVGGEIRQSLAAGRRGDEDDARPRPEQREKRPDGEECPCQVDVERPLPVFRRVAVNLVDGHDPGGVDEDRDRVEGSREALLDLDETILVGYVSRVVRSAEALRQVGEQVLPAREQMDVMPGSGERLRRRGSDAGRRTDDDRKPRGGALHRPIHSKDLTVRQRCASYHRAIQTADSHAVEGSVATGFELVLEVFEARVDDVGAGGAAFAAVVEGRVVADLWAGVAGQRPWSRETRTVVMSATKGVAATAVACLVDDGLIEVEAPVATYWPEFAAGGKADLTVANVLSHAAGLVTVPGYEDLLDPEGPGWDRTQEIVARLASAAPAWPPGSAHGYHGVTYGWLVGELVRRATGRTIGRVVAERVAEPMGLELHLGTPRELHSLVAPTILPSDPPPMLVAKPAMPDPELFDRMMLAVDGRSMLHTAARFFAQPGILELELPAQNGTATGRALAKLYGALANGGRYDGGRLLSPGTIREFARERTRGADRITGMERSWGLGFQLPAAYPPMLTTPSGPRTLAFGHSGFGGQIGFADPEHALGIGFVRSHMTWAPTLGPALTDAVYSCLAAAR
jgi:CubicO group peptidase (beta-lactamase class C family)